MKAHSGFSLIELMTVVVIMGILTTVSMGGYRQYVRRANRVDATSALLRLSTAEERFYLQNSHYATTAAELDAPPPAGLGTPETDRGLYALAIAPVADGPQAGYTATATASATGSQRDDDDCRTFSIDHSGRRGASNASGVESAETIERCWR
ncbi:MAG: type IV pilin protein [Gammaproteobacteria bacterium]